MKTKTAISAILPVLFAGGTAGAVCTAGTTDLQVNHQRLMVETNTLQAMLDHVEKSDGVNFTRDGNSWLFAGAQTPTDTDSEFNKLFHAYAIATFGLQEAPPAVQSLGGVNVLDGGIGFGKSRESGQFHRGADEWGPLLSMASLKAYDFFDPETGGFFPNQSQIASEYRVDGKEPLTFGATSRSLIHAQGDDNGVPLPSLESRVIFHSGFIFGIDQKRVEEWYCPAIETEQGEVSDQAVPTMLFHLVRNNWQIHKKKVFGKVGKCSEDASYDCSTYVGAFLGTGSAAIVRGAEIGMSEDEMAHRMLCDVTNAAADWVPVMSRYQFSAYTHDQLSKLGVFAGTPNGKNPMMCGLPAEILSTPIGNLCPDALNGDEYRCETVADCVGDHTEGYDCFEGCCVRNTVIK